MDERELLARQFAAHREHLHAVAYRMLGSATESDDAVQESWLRMCQASADGVDNLGGWMTTIVARICLDRLRARKARREEAFDGHEPEPGDRRRHERSPDADVELADSVGLALLIVLETLSPAERVAFVLHDMFDLSFDEIAPIVGRTSVATRQLASRARRRVQGASPPDVDQRRKRAVVEAFIAASRDGDFEGLMAVLDPEVVLRGDTEAVRLGGGAEIHGATAVASFFNGRARAAIPGFIDGEVGVLVPVAGRMLLVLEVDVDGEKIVSLDAVANHDTLASLALERLD